MRETARKKHWNPEAVRGYRGGYLPRERRAIEQGIRDGSVRGVVATNALELGIDIGGFEVAILVGYPGSIASTLQQMGRVGRRDSPSIAVLVGSSSPLDQFVVTHPGLRLRADARERTGQPGEPGHPRQPPALRRV